MDSLTLSLLFFVVIIFSAADEVQRKLARKVGGKVNLPGAVSELEFLLKDGKNLAMVMNRELQILEKIYEERLVWDNSSGNFILTGLKRNDSGIYRIDSKRGIVGIVDYKLAVYDAAPTPKVHPLNNSNENCSLLCSVEGNDEEITLLWYKDQEIHSQKQSAGSLSLTLNIKEDLYSSFSCVAKNPADQKNVTVNVLSTCGIIIESNNSTKEERSYLIPKITIPIVAVGLVILAAVCAIKHRSSHRKKKVVGQKEETEPEVQYTEVHFRHSKENAPVSEESVDRSSLRTVYDQLEVHRMDLTDTAQPV